MIVRKSLAAFMTAVVLASSAVAMSACEKKKGPFEKAGDEIDEAADNVSDAIDPKGPVEKAGRAIDRAVDD